MNEVSEITRDDINEVIEITRDDIIEIITKDPKITQKDLAKRLSTSQSTISRKLNLFNITHTEKGYIINPSTEEELNFNLLKFNCLNYSIKAKFILTYSATIYSNKNNNSNSANIPHLIVNIGDMNHNEFCNLIDFKCFKISYTRYGFKNIEFIFKNYESALLFKYYINNINHPNFSFINPNNYMSKIKSLKKKKNNSK